MITRRIILRYRAPGHVRFQLPPELCQPEAAAFLIAELRVLDGVYRVVRRGNKLSVRYQEAFCAYPRFTRHFHAIVTRLEQQGQLKPRPPVPRPSPLVRIKQTPLVRWFREKVEAVRETFTAFGILARQGWQGGPKFLHDPKEFAFEFANDVLVLYLIKIHWHRIVTQWLPNPIKHRYEWAAVFYLTYLLVRSRLPK
ncbi:MAG: hypothetical protein Kow0060_16710 [Methylohalobius crimeensis]